MQNKYITILIVVVLLAVGAYMIAKRGAYQAPTQTQTGSGTSTPPYQNPAPTHVPTQPMQSGSTTPSTQSNSTGTVAAKSFTVNGNDTSADLTTITVAKGTPVSITFGADAQGTYHGGLDFRSSVVSTGPIAPGSTKIVSFTATQSFSFQPYWPSTNIAKPYMISVVVK